VRTKSLICPLLLLGACASKPTVKEDPTFGDVPSWYLKPAEGAKGDEICGVGNYRAGDLDYARRQAVANARADLSSGLRSKVDAAVKNTFSDVARARPDAKLPLVDRVGEAFNQSLSSEALSGAAVKDTFVSKAGTVYVRVAVSRESVERSMQETLRQAVVLQMREHADLVEQKFREQLDKLPWNTR
jgi:hypothetical protein